MKNIEYINIIRNLGQNLIENYKNNVLEIGVNGPYDDTETEVRNLSHLCIIVAIEISKFNNKKYFSLINKMGEQLLLLQQENGLFIMRKKLGKDVCNGVIGHAWVNEALIYLYKVTKEEKYLNTAIEIASKHKFCNEIALWTKPEMEISDDNIDYTFNHQLWYAATLAELIQHRHLPKFQKEVEQFLNKIEKNINITISGRISHSIYNRIKIYSSLKQKIKKYINKIKEILNMPSLSYKEEGYHMFNVMAFARIYRIYSNHSFFKGKLFEKIIQYSNSKIFLERLENGNISNDISLKNNLLQDEKKYNIYGYPYNVPGFEILYVAKVFENMIDYNSIQECVKKQFSLIYNPYKKIFEKNCHDKITINYRIYEFYRYLELEI